MVCLQNLELEIMAQLGHGPDKNKTLHVSYLSVLSVLLLDIGIITACIKTPFVKLAPCGGISSQPTLNTPCCVTLRLQGCCCDTELSWCYTYFRRTCLCRYIALNSRQMPAYLKLASVYIAVQQWHWRRVLAEFAVVSQGQGLSVCIYSSPPQMKGKNKALAYGSITQTSMFFYISRNRLVPFIRTTKNYFLISEFGQEWALILMSEVEILKSPQRFTFLNLQLQLLYQPINNICPVAFFPELE